MWDVVLSRAPQAWIWLGDIIYADTAIFLRWRIPATAAQIAAGYALQASVPKYQKLLQQTTVCTLHFLSDQGRVHGLVLVRCEARLGGP